MNSIKKGSLALLTVLLSILLMACPQDTESSSSSNDSGIGSVYGDVSGVVKGTNNKLLSGVVVTISKNGEQVSTTTGTDGQYAFKDLQPGDYVVSFDGTSATDGRTGAAVAFEEITGQLFVSADQYKSDDPVAELQLLTKKLNAIQFAAAFNIATPQVNIDLGGGDTATPPDTVNADLSNFLKELNVSQNSMTGDYHYAIAMPNICLAPLTGTISGSIEVLFKEASNAQEARFISDVKDDVVLVFTENYTEPSTTNEKVGSTDGAVDLDTSLALEDTSGIPTEVYFVSIGSEDFQKAYKYSVKTLDGKFSITGLPAGKKFKIGILPFNQTYTNNTETYDYFINNVVGLATGATESEYVLPGDDFDILTVDGEDFYVGNIVVGPKLQDAEVIAHNIGSANTALTVDPSLSTSKINLTFSKSIDPETFSASLVTTETTPRTIKFKAEDWTTDSTVILIPEEDSITLPYGTANNILTISGECKDGSSLPSTTLNVNIIDGIKQDTATRYFTSSGMQVTNTNFPIDGKVVVNFNKDLNSDGATDVYLTATAGATDLITVVPAGFATVNGDIATFDFSLLELTNGATYTLYFSAASDDYQDFDNFVITGIVVNSEIYLLKTNLYEGDENNIYYEENPTPSATEPLLPIDDTLEFIFNRDIATHTVEAELYLAENITGYLNSDYDELKKNSIISSSNISVSGNTLVINPTNDLLPGTKYALAIKISNSAGSVLYTTRAISLDPFLDPITGDGETTTYIGFCTEQSLKPLDPVFITDSQNLVETNIKVDNITPATALTVIDGNNNIVIEINKSFVTATGIATLYRWTDAGVVNTVEDGELYDDPANVTVTVSGNTITIDPEYSLAPGYKFAVELNLTSSANSNDTYTGYVGFTTTAFAADFSNFEDIIVDGYPIENGNIETPAHGTRIGYDALDNGLKQLSWKAIDGDIIEDYMVYSKRTDGTYGEALAAPVARETSFLGILSRNEHHSTAVAIPHTGTASLDQRDALFEGAAQFYIYSVTKEGFVALSNTTLAITDTISPVISDLNVDFTGLPAPQTVTNVDGITGTITISNASEAIYLHGIAYDSTTGPETALTNVENSEKIWYELTTYAAPYNGMVITVHFDYGAEITAGDFIRLDIRDPKGNRRVIDNANAFDATVDLIEHQF